MGITFLLALSFMPLIETITLAEGLSLDAEYMPAASMVKEEGMLLSVEDFVILKGDIEISGHECETRLLYVQDLALEEIKKVSILRDAKIRRLERLNKKYNKSNLLTEKNLSRSEKSALFYKATSSILLGSTIILSIILFVK